MFSIAVKIDRLESRRRSAALLHIVVGFYLVVQTNTYYSYLNHETILQILPMLAIALISLVYGFFGRRIDPWRQYNFWFRLVQVLTFGVLGIVMMRIGQALDYISLFGWALLCLVQLFAERRIFQDTVIYLDESFVRIPGFYKDYEMAWSEFSEVIVREDFITFFHRKQKYLQFQVLQDLSTLEVAKMNAFCREKIEQQEEPAASNQ
jgi:hypothetical protein